MSGKITCDVIRDLMILCEDDVCSEDSRRLIEEHISECEECRKIYEMTNAQIPEMIFKETDKDDEVEHQAVKAFKKIKKKMTFEAIMKCGIVVLIVLMINHAWNFYVEERVNVVPSSEVEVTEVYQLKMEIIMLLWNVKDALHGIIVMLYICRKTGIDLPVRNFVMN